MRTNISVWVVLLILPLAILSCSPGGDDQDDPSGPNLSPVNDIVSGNIGTLKGIQGGTYNNGTAEMTVSSFRMSLHEITGEQYAAVMGVTDPSQFASVTNNPVERVNWYGALVFCNTLSALEGLTRVYAINGSTNPGTWGEIPTANNTTWNGATANWSANGYRLPTEAEWQFAARGGNASLGYTYAGSNTIGDVAYYCYSADSTTYPVGNLPGNELGLRDMSGNVWEWCWDWNATYPDTAQTDYRGPSFGMDRVTRGGCWFSDAEDCAVAYRHHILMHNQSDKVGFRVVRR
jgi:formylglycine-generating enzyme